jgi:hypothetical protein
MVGFKSTIVAGALTGIGLVSAAKDPEIWGFGKLGMYMRRICILTMHPGTKTTGGRGAPPSSTYTVKNFNEFKTALNNKGKPHAPKVIYIGKQHVKLGWGVS